MLACIPTRGSAGVDDVVFDHFGSAPYFTLYDSVTGEVKVLENRNAHHDHGTCHPMNQLARYHVDCVVCGGMGRRAIEALSTEGVKVYHARSERVADLIKMLDSNELPLIDPARACRGQGQRGGCGHGSFESGGDYGRGAGYGRSGPGSGTGGGRGR